MLGYRGLNELQIRDGVRRLGVALHSTNYDSRATWARTGFPRGSALRTRSKRGESSL
jgi:hypothetical protein